MRTASPADGANVIAFPGADQGRHRQDVQHAEGLAAAVAAAAGGGFVELSHEGRLLRVSRRALELFGVAEAEIEAVLALPHEARARVADLLAAQARDPEAVRDALGGHHAGHGEPHRGEIVLRGGAVLEACGVPLRHPSGAIAGRVVVIRDAGDRRAREAKLRDRARQQEAVASLGELAVNLEDPEPLLKLAVRLAAQALDVELVQVLQVSPLGNGLEVRSSNDPAADGGGGLAPALPDSLPCDGLFSSPRTRAQGFQSGICAPIRGRDRPFGVLAAFTRRRSSFSPDEVSFLETVANLLAGALARRQAEAVLADRERQLRAVFENALDALFVFDDAGSLLDANSAASRILGGVGRDIAGRPLSELLEPELLRAFDETWRGRRDGERARGGAQLRRPGGATLCVELEILADILAGRHLAVVRDVTEQRQMQARLAVTERMSSVGTFASGVAHELNNPLSYVTANLSFVADGLREALGRADADAAAALRSDMESAIDEALEGAERMRNVIRDLRTFSHADDAREAVDLASVIESSVKMAWPEIKPRARLVRTLSDVPPAHGDATRLGQAFLNLLVNAAQAISGGSPERNVIAISTRVLGDGRIAVEVTDTGCGIPGEHLNRIFDPFFTTKPPGIGAGLGLSVCHSLVTQAGGVIEVDSQVGLGSTFRVILLPAPRQGDRRDLEPPRASPRERPTGGQR